MPELMLTEDEAQTLQKIADLFDVPRWLVAPIDEQRKRAVLGALTEARWRLQQRNVTARMLSMLLASRDISEDEARFLLRLLKRDGLVREVFPDHFYRRWRV